MDTDTKTQIIEHAKTVLDTEHPNLTAKQRERFIAAILEDDRVQSGANAGMEILRDGFIGLALDVRRIAKAQPELVAVPPSREDVFAARLNEHKAIWGTDASGEDRIRLWREVEQMDVDARLDTGVTAGTAPSEKAAPEPAAPTTGKGYHHWKLNDERWTGELQRRGLNPHGLASDRRKFIDAIQAESRAAVQRTPDKLNVTDDFLALSPEKRIELARAAGMNR